MDRNLLLTQIKIIFLYAANNSPKHNKWVGVYICGVEVLPSTINPCKVLSDKPVDKSKNLKQNTTKHHEFIFV